MTKGEAHNTSTISSRTEYQKSCGISAPLCIGLHVRVFTLKTLLLKSRGDIFALRLGRFFGMPAEFWLNLQARYDLACEKARIGKRLTRDIKPYV